MATVPGVQGPTGPMDWLAMLRQKAQDPAFLDRLAQTDLDPAAFSRAMPQGMEALYAASPQQSRVPLTERQGLAAAPGMSPLAMLGAGMIEQAQEPAPQVPVGAPPRSGAAPRAQVGVPFANAVRTRSGPSLGELLTGK